MTSQSVALTSSVGEVERGRWRQGRVQGSFRGQAAKDWGGVGRREGEGVGAGWVQLSDWALWRARYPVLRRSEIERPCFVVSWAWAGGRGERARDRAGGKDRRSLRWESNPFQDSK